MRRRRLLRRRRSPPRLPGGENQVDLVDRSRLRERILNRATQRELHQWEAAQPKTALPCHQPQGRPRRRAREGIVLPTRAPLVLEAPPRTSPNPAPVPQTPQCAAPAVRERSGYRDGLLPCQTRSSLADQRALRLSLPPATFRRSLTKSSAFVASRDREFMR
jgi:hypothetical protein